MIACMTEPGAIAHATERVGTNHHRLSVSDGEITPSVRFLVTPGTAVRLSSVDPEYRGAYLTRESAIPETRFYAHKIDELQYVMYAERKHALLIVLQGIDAGGKDGVVRHLLAMMNPAGCSVIGFKQPTTIELGHDFLWRIHAHTPPKGGVAIFNRSHYEDVLTVRVNRLVPSTLWSKRYELINDFEKLLVIDNNTTILKFFLHISKEEQLARFKQRLDDPSRRWKISECDYRERTHWSEYMDAFGEMLARTSTREAPWFIIPGNYRWYRDLVIAHIVAEALERLNMRLPEPSVDITRIRNQYYTAERRARQDKQLP